jgi:hypothetical protein
MIQLERERQREKEREEKEGEKEQERERERGRRRGREDSSVVSSYEVKNLIMEALNNLTKNSASKYRLIVVVHHRNFGGAPTQTFKYPVHNSGNIL